jgi:hypothetical protein
VLLVLYAVAWVNVLVNGSPPLNSSGTPLGGDFIAFHAAARLIVAGRGAELYDHAAISTIQDGLLGGRVPNFYDAYRNPPFYALLYVPFAGLDLLPAFAGYTVLSLAALGAALWLLLEEAPAFRWRWRGLVILVFAFPAVYFGLIDGENATFSLLLYVLIYRALRSRNEGKASGTSAGVWAALGLFKPQLFLLFPLLFLLRRQWRALLAYAITAVVLALISLAAVGPQGMQGWPRILLEMESANATANAWRMASLKTFFEQLTPGATVLAQALYVLASLVLVAGLVKIWSARVLRLPLAWAFASLTAVLIDPHLVDYDLTVLVAAGVLALPLVRAAQWLTVALYPLLLLRAAVPLGDASLLLTATGLAALAWVAFSSNQSLTTALDANGPSLEAQAHSSATATSA